MQNFFKFIAMGTLLVVATQPAKAAPTFTASTGISQPSNGQVYHGTEDPAHPGLSATITIQSNNHYVQVTGEAPNAIIGVQYDLYLADNQGDTPDDYYSGVQTCDASGKFRHDPNSSDSLTFTGLYISQSPASRKKGFTAHAVAKIFDTSNPTNQGASDTPVQFIIVYP